MDARRTNFTYAAAPAKSAPPSDAPRFDAKDEALLELLGRLDAAGHQFVTPAPNTHRRLMLRRRRARAGDLADIFGWCRWFSPADIDPDLLALLRTADALDQRAGRLRSRLCVARAGDGLYLHSGFPVRGEDHVFFGPDTYRFIDFIRAEGGGIPRGAAVADIGTGAGAGGLFAASLVEDARLLLTDVNQEALRLARINAAFAGVSPTLRRSEGLPADAGPFDLIVANPPYICSTGLTYSEGGGELGSGLTADWAEAGMRSLAPGGRLLLYSGSAIVRGHDALRETLARLAQEAGCTFTYRELDPDVFPATLARPAYWRAERIAAFGAVMTRPAA